MSHILKAAIFAVAMVILFVFSLLALWVIILMVSAVIVNPKKEYKKNSKYYRFLLYVSTSLARIGSGSRIHVKGLDCVPKNGRFLIVGNHRSKFDPIFTWYILRKSDIAYISKPENFKVFCFGRIIRKCLFLPINRTDPREALKSLIAASDLIKSDEVSIGLYPEGTRSKDLTLLPFHDGIFKVAKMAEVPIVVVATTGTENIKKNFPFKKTDIYYNFIETIPTEFVKENSTHTISARVRADMEQNL